MGDMSYGARAPRRRGARIACVRRGLRFAVATSHEFIKMQNNMLSAVTSHFLIFLELSRTQKRHSVVA